MKHLQIIWQRLVDDTGKTCDRCGDTQLQLHNAVEDLKQALAPLGIEVSLEEKMLDARAFACDTSQSNRIWIPVCPWRIGLVRVSVKVLVPVKYVAMQNAGLLKWMM